MENKMDNELDFRVGDVVCDCRLGTGKVCESPLGAVLVEFESDVKACYTLDGKSHRSHQCRALYHGTWEQVFGNLPDIKPKRKVKRWVNLYTSGEWELYDSKEKARYFSGINPSNPIAVAVEIEVNE